MTFAANTGFAQDQAAVKPPPVAFGSRLGGDNAKTRFVAELTYAIGYNVYVLADPFRVIVDLPEVEFQLPESSGQKGRGLISGYRFGRIDETRSRIVLDATGPVLIDKSFILHPRDGQPARLVIDLITTTRTTFNEYQQKEHPQPPPAPPAMTALLAPDAEPAAADDTPVDAPLLSAKPEELTDSAEAPAQTTDPIASLLAPQPVPIPQPRPKKLTVAKLDQSANRPRPRNAKRIIVLDPGHGGIDPGALSRNKRTKEKTIVLEFARGLKAKLDTSGRYKVILTRTADRFLTLRERVKVARDAKADLFVAIHADAIRGRSARGATVYTVSETASDEEAAELAHNENRADIIAGVDLGGENDDITGILIDLAQRETKNYSVSIAKRIVQHLKPVTKLTSRPMRSAGFRVLKAPDVPSILLELGYLSNRADERLMTSKGWRKKVTTAVVRAIDSYFATRLAAGN